jgi:adenylate cyclase
MFDLHATGADEARVEIPLLVAFVDLLGYAMQATRWPDDELAAAMDGYYELIGTTVAAAGGRVVKLIGDGALIVFDVGDADAGVLALLALKDDIDRYFSARGSACTATVKAHVGPVIAGPYGPRGDKRFDVLGKTVNTTAMLDATGVALSVEAFRKLSPATRQRFKKHTWPITYIRAEDPHRFRRR